MAWENASIAVGSFACFHVTGFKRLITSVMCLFLGNVGPRFTSVIKSEMAPRAFSLCKLINSLIFMKLLSGNSRLF